MEKMRIQAFVMMFSGLFCLSQAFGQDSLSGREIIDKMDKANISKTGLVAKSQLELKDISSGSSEKRRCVSIMVSENGLKKSLFRFMDSSYKGTTFLALEQPGNRKLQYVFLKSVGSPRQVEASDKENNFLDTDIANEDMGGVNPDDYTFKRLDDKTFDGKDCYVVERIAAKFASKFSKTVLAIDKLSLVPVDVRFYNKENRLIKTIKSSDIRKVGDGVFQAYQSIITSIPDKHQSIIQTLDIAEKPLQNSLFNKEKMGSPWSE
jgi:hypothetical protein